MPTVYWSRPAALLIFCLSPAAGQERIPLPQGGAASLSRSRDGITVTVTPPWTPAHDTRAARGPLHLPEGQEWTSGDPETGGCLHPGDPRHSPLHPWGHVALPGRGGVLPPGSGLERGWNGSGLDLACLLPGDTQPLEDPPSLLRPADSRSVSPPGDHRASRQGRRQTGRTAEQWASPRWPPGDPTRRERLRLCSDRQAYHCKAFELLGLRRLSAVTTASNRAESLWIRCILGALL